MFDNDHSVLCAHIEIDEAQLEKSPVEEGRHAQDNLPRPFIAALQSSAEGRPLMIKLTQVKDFSRENMKSWLEENLGGHCEATCDTQHCYENMCALCQDNMAIELRGENKKSRHWLKLILSNMKASIYATYHNINYESYGYRYLADLQYRFNRRFNLKEMFYGLISLASLRKINLSHKFCRL